VLDEFENYLVQWQHCELCRSLNFWLSKIFFQKKSYCRKFSSKNAYFGEIRGSKLKFGAPNNLLCRKFAAVCQNSVGKLQRLSDMPIFLTHDAAAHDTVVVAELCCASVCSYGNIFRQ